MNDSAYLHEPTKHQVSLWVKTNSPRVSLVEIRGKSEVWQKFRRVGIDGSIANFVYCITCGCVLYYQTRYGTSGMRNHRCFAISRANFLSKQFMQDDSEPAQYSYTEEWEGIPEFSLWLQKSNCGPDKVYCRQCNIDFSIVNGGIQDIEQHRREKHINLPLINEDDSPPIKVFKTEVPAQILNQLTEGPSPREAIKIVTGMKENGHPVTDKQNMFHLNRNSQVNHEHTPMNVPAPLSNGIMFPDIITLNVGGCHYQTSLASLTKYPGSLLGAMFTGRHPIPRDNAGRYFIDCNGANFIHILNFLNQEMLPPSDCVVNVYKMALNFGLGALVEELAFHPKISRILARENIRRRFQNYDQVKRNLIKTAISNCQSNRLSEIYIHAFSSTSSTNPDHKCVAGKADIFFGPWESFNDTEAFVSCLEYDLKEEGFSLIERNMQSCTEILNDQPCPKVLYSFTFSFK